MTKLHNYIIDILGVIPFQTQYMFFYRNAIDNFRTSMQNYSIDTMLIENSYQSAKIYQYINKTF